MTDHLAQLRAMLQFERSLVDRVGPPGCAARETATRNVAALEWVLTPATFADAVVSEFAALPVWDGVNRDPAVRPQGSPDAWDRSRDRRKP